jgi:topoisomerase-4 subunit A
MSVVMGRALPHVTDGLKPVQRRILFAMHELGLYQPARHVKSARVVGDVIGKYHPHGDSAAYEALVRQAQAFTLRYPLIDGQGNFGSLDGDGAAAMRYTECRLTPMASLLLSEINEDTVDLVANYDGSFQEPQRLPARLPILLLNGASGIGVGMATEIPPHNLREVSQALLALLDNPQITLEQILSYIPGPDFPGGGHLVTPASEVETIYAHGRGSFRLRARWKKEQLARGQWRLVITELPHGVSTKVILEEIEKITNPKIKDGKKVLTPEQIQLKALMLGAIEWVRDESDKQASVRLVFEPKSSRQSEDGLIQLLLTHTSLESGVSVNLVALGLDGRPRQKVLLSLLQEWIEFRFQTIKRRTGYRLRGLEHRIHILQGRQQILLHLDEVIQLIRESDEPKQELMSRYGLSEIQAEDVLEIRLRQLARLEVIKIEAELKQSLKRQRELQSLLDNPQLQRKLIRDEIIQDSEAFGDARRTLIREEPKVIYEAPVLDEPVTVTVSQQGWIRLRQGHHLDIQNFNYKAGDGLGTVLELRTVHQVGVMDQRGRVYNIKVADIPGGRGDGVPLSSLLEFVPNAKIIAVFAVKPNTRFWVVSSDGYGFVTDTENLLVRVKAGKSFLTLPETATPVALLELNDEAIQGALLTELGHLLVLNIDQIKELPKGRGVKLIELPVNDFVLSCCVVSSHGIVVEGVQRSGKLTSLELHRVELRPFTMARAKKGGVITQRLKPQRVKPL